MWAELGHLSPCIFGTLHETKVFDLEGQTRKWASPNQAGHHGEATARRIPNEASAVVFACPKANVSGQPNAPAIAANGKRFRAIAGDICVEQSASCSTPHPLQISLLHPSIVRSLGGRPPFDCASIISFCGKGMPHME